MKSSTKIYARIASSLLIILWVYAAFSKLIDFNQFREQMYRQTIPHWFANGLIWTLPGIELFAAALLSIDKVKETGFLFSSLLLTVFTLYIALVLLNFFGRVPCSCGGVIKALGWKLHLLFNLFFLLLSFSGCYILNRERGAGR